MELEQISDYSVLTEKLIPARFSNKKNFVEGLLGSTNPQFNDLDEANYQIFTQVWLDTAVGVQLDFIGNLLVLDRLDRDDESYRALLQLKVSINTGAGQPELIIRIIKELYTATEVHYIPNYPAGFIIQQNGSIGLFLLTEMEIDDGSFLLLDDGNPLCLREPDTAAESILELVIPSGVDIQIVNI